MITSVWSEVVYLDCEAKENLKMTTYWMTIGVDTERKLVLNKQREFEYEEEGSRIKFESQFINKQQRWWVLDRVTGVLVEQYWDFRNPSADSEFIEKYLTYKCTRTDALF